VWCWKPILWRSLNRDTVLPIRNKQQHAAAKLLLCTSMSVAKTIQHSTLGKCPPESNVRTHHLSQTSRQPKQHWGCSLVQAPILLWYLYATILHTMHGFNLQRKGDVYVHKYIHRYNIYLIYIIYIYINLLIYYLYIIIYYKMLFRKSARLHRAERDITKQPLGPNSRPWWSGNIVPQYSNNSCR
jgi:hypothetical protein